jgi:hypothetical protein
VQRARLPGDAVNILIPCYPVFTVNDGGFIPP